MKVYRVIYILLLFALCTPGSAEAQIKRWLRGKTEKSEQHSAREKEDPKYSNERHSFDPVSIYKLPMNRLGDLQNSLSHDYPEVFLITPLDVETREEEDPTSGFRIQLYSTRDVAIADSLRAEFRMWSDSLFAEYQPEAYLDFRQPYYKIHIGDFKNRELAIQVARYLKRWYGDAWVVYDKIDPDGVPSDTMSIFPKSIPKIKR